MNIQYLIILVKFFVNKIAAFLVIEIFSSLSLEVLILISYDWCSKQTYRRYPVGTVLYTVYR
jgi:hypothetical protein